ncbi:MAG: Ig domain-containing protein [Alistipes sp.]|nr:Ig domain-containing protein [Alistipes sp.]
MKKSLLHILVSVSIAAIGFFGVACSGDDEGGNGAGGGENGNVALTAIALDKTSLLMEVGESVTLNPVFTPANATNKSVKWNCDSSAAEVYEGVVTALSVGQATVSVTADDGGYKALCNVKVVADKNAVFVESIEFSKESYAMIVGDVLALVPTVLPQNADNKKLAWSTQDTSIISVNEQGMVEALAIGNATVTALATDGSGVSATVAIAVSNPATEVNFSGSDSYAKYTTWHGNKFELDVRTTPANADLRTLNWSFQTLNGKANPEGVSYEVTADKATVCCVVDENSTRDGCKVKVSTADNSDYADAQVDFLTYAWIMASKNHGATFEYGAHALCGTSNWRFNYEAKDYLGSQLYFVAYCPSDEQHMAEASPLDYYPNDIIPTSEYSLTSSDPEKLSLEKLEGKGYKLNFLADDMAAVDLTYTCGDFVQTYRINIIP